MYVEKNKSGTYKFVERFSDPLTNKTMRVSVSLEKNNPATRRKAQEILQEKIDKALSQKTSVENLTFSKLVELYLADQEHTVAKSTYKRNSQYSNYIAKLLGEDTLVERLNAGYVKSRMYSNSNKPSTINERYKRFKAIMRWAYENDYVDDIRWIDKIKTLNDKEKREKLQDKYLEKDQLTILVENMEITRWKYLTQLMVLSGMRCGEAIALENSDIDFENKLIHVSKNYDSRNNIVTSPKTSCSNRDIHMQQELYDLCKEIADYTKKEKKKSGVKSNLFLCDLNGAHLKYFSFNKYLRNSGKKHLNKAISTHILRHTHVSLMAESGVPIEAITRRVGHENSSITKEVYYHATKRQIQIDNSYIDRVSIF